MSFAMQQFLGVAYPQKLGVEGKCEDPVDLLHSQGLYIISRHAVDTQVVAHGLDCPETALMGIDHPLGIQMRVFSLEVQPDAVHPVL